MLGISQVLKDSLRAHGPVLGRLLSTWAVVGDVTNEVDWHIRSGGWWWLMIHSVDDWLINGD